MGIVTGLIGLITGAAKAVAAYFGYQSEKVAAAQGAAGQKVVDGAASTKVGDAIARTEAQPTGADLTKEAQRNGDY